MTDLIERFGIIEQPTVTVNILADLAESVVSQQLSIKAADTIWKRVAALLPRNSLNDPDDLLILSDQALRDCGVSFAKIRALRAICESAKRGDLDLTQLMELDDVQLSQHLQQLRGIGPWTAEMIMIFSLGRPDIFSPGDTGLRNAVSRLYGLDKNNLAAISELSKQWRPYRSYACRYLWKSLDND